jgi:hypothetical protein
MSPFGLRRISISRRNEDVTSCTLPAYPVRAITAATRMSRSNNDLSKCRCKVPGEKKAARMSGRKSREETPKKGSSHEANLESA